ncbi:MAG: DNA-processing protein DprA [Clostridia bacterium]|nr:DNA-processing protein DprA [Clostridia bacterium]
MKISESKILYWLSLCGASPRKQTALISKYGSLEKLWDNFNAQKGEIAEFLGKNACEKLYRFHDIEYIENSLLNLRAENIMVITAKNPLYPQNLLQKEVGAPLVFYYKGDINLLNTFAIAIVGTRNCTAYGKQVCEEIATTLARSGQVSVASGVATGIDTYAIDGAINAGGKVIAVLPCGHNKITPVSSAKLVDKIIQNGGLVISEYPPTFEATKFTYPERNRLISGISRGVVVVEAGEKSGALITANCALEQNREVFAVPGPLNSSRSVGCNNLLYEGANFIRGGDDILSFFSLKSQNAQPKNEINPKIFVDKEQEKVYSLLLEGSKTYDEIIVGTGLSAQRVSEILLDLELDDIIERTGANLFELKK